LDGVDCCVAFVGGAGGLRAVAPRN